MKKISMVFAVLFFCFSLVSCSQLDTMKSMNPVEDLASSILYSIPGDFNNDGNQEQIYISKPENGKPYLKLVAGDKSYYKELPYNFDNYNTHVIDVNGDNKEDFILYVNENNHERIYIYSYDNGLNEIFSSESFKNMFTFAKKKQGYVFAFGNYEKQIENNKSSLFMEFYHTDINFDTDIPSFVLDGSIRDYNNIIYTISISFSINANNKADIHEIIIHPYNDI